MTPEFQAGLWMGCAVGVSLAFVLLMAAFAIAAAGTGHGEDDE
jgi:hypothetical protein